MPKPKPTPFYIIVRSHGLMTHPTLQEAIEAAKKFEVDEPGAGFWVCQVLVSVDSSFAHQLTKHY